MFIKRIKDFLPRFPRKRYNIFTGTVSFAQWLKILKIWIIKPNIDDVGNKYFSNSILLFKNI